MVEGLRLIELTDEAGPGEVWRARATGGIGGRRGDALPGDLPGMGESLVRLVRLPVEESVRGRGRALAHDLVALDDPGLVGVREVRRADDGVALVLAPLPMHLMPLTQLARRRQLAAGEIVTLGVALAWALETAHAAGITHGRLRDCDVLLDEWGRPSLAGVGVMGVLGSPGDPADDLRALARLLASLLDRSSPGAAPVTDVLGDHARAGAETHAGALAASLADAAPAAPIRLGEAPAEITGSPDETRRRGTRRRRAGALLGAAVAIVVLSGVVGWVSAPAARGERSAKGRPPVAASPDWGRELASLDAARAAAFADPVHAALRRVDAPATSALAADTAALSALLGRRAHAHGLRMVLERVVVTGRSAGQVTLEVTDHLLPYELLDGSANVMSRVPGRASARHLITLRDVGAPGHPAWRLAAVAAPKAVPAS